MNRLAYLLSLICILAFSSCEEDKVYYHTAAKADFTIGENMYELGQTAVFKDASIPDEGSRIVAWLWEFGDTKILQKSGIQKNEVIELIYRGFI